VDQVPRRFVPGERISHLTGDPLRGRIVRHTDARVNHEQIDRRNAIPAGGMIAQECFPTLGGWLSLPKTSSRMTERDSCATWRRDVRAPDKAPARRTIPTEVTGEARGRKHCPASAGDHSKPQVPGAVRLQNIDRLVFVWLYRKPETVIRWHRCGFRVYWHWKSRRGGRPKIDREICELIRRMSKENPLLGVPRIHGELLMLGIEVAQSTVARYMTRRQGPPSQGWKIFLRNHAAGIASVDLFVVRTISFKLLYGLIILRHARRRLVSISVTNNPTAEWIAG